MGTHRSKRVVIALRLSTQTGRRTLQGIFRYITTKRLHWDIRLKRDSDEFGLANVNRFPRWHIDGIIFGMNAPDERLDDSIRAIARQKAPLVAVDIRDQPALESRSDRIAFVNTDTDSVGKAAAEFLVGHGTYRAYGYVTDYRKRSWSILRGAAFAKALGQKGLGCTQYEVSDVERDEDDFEGLCGWLRKLKKPAALFVAFDDRAITVLEACRATGIRVPQDIAILGVDDDELIDENAEPALSSIHPDNERQGFIAAERLHALMSGKHTVQRQTFIPILKISPRATTIVTADTGALIQKATAFIDTNFRNGIDPTTVAQHLKISRRLLDLRFHEIAGTSVNRMIRDRQLDEVCHRLVHTNDKIDRISSDCGFSNPGYLKELFKRRLKMTMSDYRRQRTS